jgi:hypothetical protein
MINQQVPVACGCLGNIRGSDIEKSIEQERIVMIREDDRDIFAPFDCHEKDTDGEDFLFEMANLFQNDTGLDMIIWVDVNRRGKHNDPRLKVSSSHSKSVHEGDLIPVLLSENPRILARNKQNALSPEDLRQVGKYIGLNKAVLLQYWNGEISTGELMKRLKKL